MKVEIYHGHIECLDLFESFCENTVTSCTDEDIIGQKIILISQTDFTEELICIISRAIVEVYLKDYILGKIYSEYNSIDAFESCSIIETVIKDLSTSQVMRKTKNIISKHGKLNLPSMILFNIKNIMSTVNKLTDAICEDAMYQKERTCFLNMIRTYSALSERNCKFADVDFKSDNTVSVTVDDEPLVDITSDKLLQFLTQRAPYAISLHHSENSPWLAALVSELFCGY
ncbi:MAG: hypothetical protein IKA95_04320 [Clostridia bacterium]|nr:hypothetical protein [Clostridia bacterium]